MTIAQDYDTAVATGAAPAVIGNYLLLRNPEIRGDLSLATGDAEAAVLAALEVEKQAQEVTTRQAHAALIVMNKDGDAEAAIAAIPDTQQRKLVNNWYERSNVWQYSNPLLTQFAASLGIDKDAFFALAKTL